MVRFCLSIAVIAKSCTQSNIVPVVIFIFQLNNANQNSFYAFVGLLVEWNVFQLLINAFVTPNLS